MIYNHLDSVRMILQSLKKSKGKTMMDLTCEGIALAGYVLYRDGKFVEGIFVHDPRGLPNYQKNIFIPTINFERILPTARLLRVTERQRCLRRGWCRSTAR